MRREVAAAKLIPGKGGGRELRQMRVSAGPGATSTLYSAPELRSSTT